MSVADLADHRRRNEQRLDCEMGRGEGVYARPMVPGAGQSRGHERSGIDHHQPCEWPNPGRRGL